MVPTKNLIQPDRSRMIRSLDANFVQSLKKKMELDPSAPGVPPIAVMCVDLEVSIIIKYDNAEPIYMYFHFLLAHH